MSERFDIVIVGGSVAATRAAEAATKHAPALSVTVITDEPHAPYERPPLSKVGLDEPLDLEALTYPAVRRLREQGVVIAVDTRAERLDVEARTVHTSRGPIEYGALVVATGCDPIIPPLFSGLDDVYALRSFDDALALRLAVAGPERSVAIVGAGFIGGEFAATLVKQRRDVALVDLDPKPLGRFGDPVAEAYAALHREAGVTLHLGGAVVEVVEGSRGRALRLNDGTVVPADVILVGVGVSPATGWLASSGIGVEGGVHCDATLQAADRVFAAGDLVRWPNERYGATMRVEHWTNAAEQGRVAGINAANSVVGGAPALMCSTVPYFWSDQHDVRIQFAGYRTGAELLYEHRGAGGVLYFYRSDEDVAGILAFDRRAEFVRLRAALRKPLRWGDLAGVADLDLALV